MVCAILVEGIWKKSCENILNLDQPGSGEDVV